ncbi:MAG: DUF4838 domain-containing protein [Clostridia bacterium]|nr:DUF4838 domain-containing protein [Clostridia bacterium]
MKKAFIVLLCLVLVFGAVSCGNKGNGSGVDISKYTIVYREVMGSYVEEFTLNKFAALRLQDMIRRNYGVELNIQNDSEEAAEYEIIIGDARGHEAVNDSVSYSLKSEGENIHISAGSAYAYSNAFDKLTENTVFGKPVFPKNIDAQGKVNYEAQKEEDFVYVSVHEMTRTSKEPPVKSITVNGVDISKYKIIYHEWEMKTFGLNEVYAAQELQKYIELATDIKLPLETDDTEPSEYEIVVGITSREGDTVSKIDRSDYGEETLLIKTEGKNLILTGAERRGTLYAVYSFLEEYLGYRFFAQDCEVVYKSEAIDIPAELNDRQTPYLEYRDCDQYQILPHEYAAKRKINSNFRRTMSYYLGGNFSFGSEFVHTMATTFDLAPQSTQPCFSDEENYQKTLEKLLTLCSRLDDVKIISVTQNDNYNYCKCAACSRANVEEKSTAGSLIRFINRLADAIKPEYPDVKILTLAYMFSIDPPKTAPADNVVVMYCPIESCCGCPLNDEDCSKNRDFNKDLEGWCELSDNIYIWYYIVEFTQDDKLPFMNFDAMYDNYKYFKQIGVKGMFNEGHLQDNGDEFGALRSYLLSLLMWDPDITKEEYNSEIRAFIDAYYGEASELVEEYFFALEISSDGKHFAQYTTANAIFKTDYIKTLKDEMELWWKKAKDFEVADTKIRSHLDELYSGYEFFIGLLKV